MMKKTITSKTFKEIAKNSFQKAKTERTRHEREMDMALRLVQPVRQLFNNKSRSSFDRTVQYDATAIESLSTTQTMIQSQATPTGSKWFDIAVKQEHRGNLNILVKRKIQHHNDTVEDSVRDSGFHVAFGLTLFDILGPGTGVMAKYLDPIKGPRWFNVPITEIFLLYDEKSAMYHRVFRQYKMTVMDIMNKYAMGDDATNLPEEIKKCYEDNKLEERFNVIECQMTFDDEDWFCCYIEGEKGDDWEELSKPKPLPSRMYYPVRWQPMPGEHWGDGLVRQALPHIQTAHAVRRLQLKHSEFAALGAWQSLGDSIINWHNKKITAGKIFPSAQKLEALTLPGNIDILEPILQREEQVIRRILLADLIPPPEDTGKATAYEFGQRLRLFVERAGAPALNMEQEGLKPMIEGHTKDLEHIKKLEPIATKGNVFDFKINSIIKRGREAEEVMKAIETITVQANIAQLTGDDTGLLMIDKKALAQKIYDMRGFWPDVLISDEELRTILNNRANMNRAQQGLDMAGQGAQLLGAVSGTGINSNNMPEVLKNALNSVREAGANIAEAQT